MIQSLIQWRVVSALALVMLLAGCFAPPLKVPTSGPIAELTVSRAEGATSARLFPYIYERPDCHGMASLERMERDTMDERVTKLVANRPTLLRISSFDWDTNVSCAVGVVFDPQDGARYRAIWSIAANKCYVRLGRINSVNGQDVLVPERSTRPAPSRC